MHNFIYKHIPLATSTLSLAFNFFKAFIASHAFAGKTQTAAVCTGLSHTKLISIEFAAYI